LHHTAMQRLSATLIVMLFVFIAHAQVQITQHRSGKVYVTKVVDGDTFWVKNGDQELKVRFIGIDAPETRNAGRKKIGYFGKEAKDYVTALTLQKWVRLEFDVGKKDRYQRLLAYVYLEDGTFLNAHLVARGYAIVDTHPPNIKYVELFTALQRQAREQQLGLWKPVSAYGFP